MINFRRGIAGDILKSIAEEPIRGLFEIQWISMILFLFYATMLKLSF